jgi:uncharacterized protein (TIGR00369 family)
MNPSPSIDCNRGSSAPPGQSLLAQVPYARYLGIEEVCHNGKPAFQMTFQNIHLGNPLLRTFHGGVLASFAEVVATVYMAREQGLDRLPRCASMTFDYLRPAFAGALQAVPTLVRGGKRISTVSVQVFLAGKLVCAGRFIFANSRVQASTTP